MGKKKECESCRRKRLQLGGYMPCSCNEPKNAAPPPRRLKFEGWVTV